MATKLIDLQSAPSTRSELSVFEVPTTQVVFDSSRWIHVPSATPVTSAGPYEFTISDSRNYLQLSKLYVAVRLKLTHPDKTNVALINYIGATFFNQVKVEINNNQIFNCTDYAYKAYLEALLNYGTDQKNGFLQAAGYRNDSSAGLDDGKNEGFKERLKMCQSGEIDLIAPLHIDHFTTDRLLIPHLNIHIQLYRNSDAFVCESHDATAPTASVTVESMSLFVKAVNVISSANLALEKALLSRNARYPYTRTRIKCISVPGGRRDLPFATIFNDIIPRRIVVGCVKQSAYGGEIGSSPFNFQPFGISEMTVDAGGSIFPSQPIVSNFGEDKYAQSFLMFFENVGAISDQRNLAIDYAKYKNGYTLFAFNLSATDSNSDFELVRTGTTQLHVKFGESTPSSGIHLIVYAEYDGMYQIDHFRNIHMDQET